MKKLKIYRFNNLGWLTTVRAISDNWQREMDWHIVDNHGRVVGDWIWKDAYDVGHGIYSERVKFPIIFRVSEGKRYRDIIDTEYWMWNVLISNKLKTLLENNNLSGWQTYPIKLYDKKDIEIDGYNGFSVIGRGGEFEDKDDIDIVERLHNNIKWKYKMSNWDGSDFFSIGYSFYVTERVKKLFRENKIDAAIRFVPWEEEIELVG